MEELAVIKSTPPRRIVAPKDVTVARLSPDVMQIPPGNV